MVRFSHGMKQPNSKAGRSKLGNGQAEQLLSPDFSSGALSSRTHSRSHAHTHTHPHISTHETAPRCPRFIPWRSPSGARAAILSPSLRNTSTCTGRCWRDRWGGASGRNIAAEESAGRCGRATADNGWRA
jgi:hypothetical protein